MPQVPSSEPFPGFTLTQYDEHLIRIEKELDSILHTSKGNTGEREDNNTTFQVFQKARQLLEEYEMEWQRQKDSIVYEAYKHQLSYHRSRVHAFETQLSSQGAESEASLSSDKETTYKKILARDRMQRHPNLVNSSTTMSDTSSDRIPSHMAHTATRIKKYQSEVLSSLVQSERAVADMEHISSDTTLRLRDQAEHVRGIDISLDDLGAGVRKAKRTVRGLARRAFRDRIVILFAALILIGLIIGISLRVSKSKNKNKTKTRSR